MSSDRRTQYRYLVLIGICLLVFLGMRWTGELTLQWGSTTPIYDTDSTTVTGDLYISPYGTQDEILDLMATTKYSLQMRNYQITEKKILTMLKNLAQLGVDIDIILENKTFGDSSKEYDKVVAALEPLGVEIRSDEHLGTNFTHAKTVIIDNSAYIISTANMSYTSFWRNREYRFVGQQEHIIENLQTLFAADRDGQRIARGTIDPAILWCPTDCRRKITDALRSAQHTIQIQAQYIQDDDIVAALRRRQLDGVDIQVLVGEHQDDGRLEGLGTGVRIQHDPYNHAKNIAIDDQLLIVGSMNLSTNGLDNNREIGIMIDDPSVVADFVRQFGRDWEESKEIRGLDGN